MKNLFTLLEDRSRRRTPCSHFQEQYAGGTLRYSELKPALAEAVVAELNPVRERREELAAHPERVWEALDSGRNAPAPSPLIRMREVREKMGLRRV